LEDLVGTVAFGMKIMKQEFACQWFCWQILKITPEIKGVLYKTVGSLSMKDNY